MNISESDWKLFGPLREKALARLCDRILSEIAVTSAEDTLSSHEKYLKIYSSIRDHDREVSQIFDGYSRSKALMQLSMIQSHELLEPEEFECFGESTREYLNRFKQ
jgi:hypothetical protein